MLAWCLTLVKPPVLLNQSTHGLRTHHIGDEEDGQAEQGSSYSIDTDLAAKDPEPHSHREGARSDLLVARQRPQLLQFLPALPQHPLRVKDSNVPLQPALLQGCERLTPTWSVLVKNGSSNSYISGTGFCNATNHRLEAKHALAEGAAGLT